MTPSDEDEPPGGSGDEILEAARTLIRRLIQAQGLTLGEIDAKLNYARGYVSRLIHGQARLTYKHILDITEAIEVNPALFFSTLHPYPAAPPRELEAGLRELRAVFDRVLPPVKDPAPPPEVPSGFSAQNLQERIESAVRTVRRNRISAEA
jgi:transcriptional regulator with XRE-family HTH domain